MPFIGARHGVDPIIGCARSPFRWGRLLCWPPISLLWRGPQPDTGDRYFGHSVQALIAKEQFPTLIVFTPTPKLECNVMRKLSAIALVVMIMAPLPAIAYTQEDADACTPDAFRLCQQAIPDASRITLCLVQNR